MTIEAGPRDFEDYARSNRFEINLGAIAVAMPLFGIALATLKIALLGGFRQYKNQF